MRVAAVDLGTNTTRLLVADVVDGRLEPVVRREAITRLGESVDRRRVLLPTSIARVRNVLVDYRREAERLGAERVLAVGTSAVRDAENGEAFLGEVEWSYGFATGLLDGPAEAELMLRGVASARPISDGTVVVDIGGGSTELVTVANGRAVETLSIAAGSVRLTERFLSEPPTQEELEACAARVCQCSGVTPEVPESRTSELHAVAGQIALALPSVVEEVVLTGSVSRGVADDLSDVEMLLVTAVRLDLAQCFENARNVGLVDLDTWGAQGTEVSRVFGYYEGIPIETIWWTHDFAEESVEALMVGERSMAADALVNGVALRTVGLLETWQARLRVYPDAVAAAHIEEAALAWGGFHPTGFLTLARPHERLALIEYLYNDAVRVLEIVYALNRVWQPTSKRLADRVGSLAVKPSRLAERIEEALTEPDPLRAMLVMSELQVDTADLAPTGLNIERARRWLREVVAVLREAIDCRAM